MFQFLLFLSRNYFVSAIVRKVKMRGNITHSGSGGNEGSHSLELAAFIRCTELFFLNNFLESTLIVDMLLSEAVDTCSEISYISTMKSDLSTSIE